MTKGLMLLAVVLCQAMPAIGAGGQKHLVPYFPNWPTSVAKSNVFVAFVADSSAHFRADEPIRFGFGSTNKLAYNVLLLDPKWGFRISATNALGAPVSKTRLGSEYGKKFDEVTSFSQGQLASSGHSGNPSRPYWTLATPAGPTAGVPTYGELPPAQELFDFRQAGDYVMVVEVQVWCYPLGSGRPRDSYLVRLPAVQLKVTKNSYNP